MRGYTLIELLIYISITGLLITLGTSAYRESQNRQAIRQDVETALEILNSAKKEAIIGKKDCADNLLGIRVTLNSNSISKQAICQSTQGELLDYPLKVSTFSLSQNFLFRPVSGSTDLTPLGLTFALNSTTNHTATINISQAGAITHVTP
jgi:type II secretory pathway pseudopilin PulG